MNRNKKISLRKDSDNNYENNSPSEFVEQKKYEPMSYEQAKRIYGSPKYIQDQIHDHPELATKYNEQRMNSKHQFSSAYRAVTVTNLKTGIWYYLKKIVEDIFTIKY